MKLFKTSQIKELDTRTCALEGISSLELMDRAALALRQRIRKHIHRTQSILVVAGPGNNGGDGLVVARLLLDEGYQVKALLCHQNKLSADAIIQLDRLKSSYDRNIYMLEDSTRLDGFEKTDVVIDALFGSGLNRPLNGFYADVIHWINRQKAFKIAIDLPSGLHGEDNRSTQVENIVQADLVLGLQFPRLAFLLAENEPFVKEWELVDIGISAEAVNEMQTSYSLTELSDIHPLLKKRDRFSHKGSFGKGLLIAGSPGMMGAAILSSKAAMRSGMGLLSVLTPAAGVSILQTANPEAIVLPYQTEGFFEKSSDLDTSLFSFLAVGPGLRAQKAQAVSLERILKHDPRPVLLDADALNLLAENKSLLDLLPQNSILTPHPKEFDRLAGNPSLSDYERLEKARTFASEHQVFVVLKGPYTACIQPNGCCCFNSTGNPGMATAGSGDVLTGILLSLLVQGYTPETACKMAVFLHGLSGDLALKKQSQESLLASDLINYLGKAFKKIES